MKIKKSELQRIIKEEAQAIQDEEASGRILSSERKTSAS